MVRERKLITPVSCILALGSWFTVILVAALVGSKYPAMPRLPPMPDKETTRKEVSDAMAARYGSVPAKPRRRRAKATI